MRALTGGSKRAAVVAQVASPVDLTVIGIRARGPGYVQDVMHTLQEHADLLLAGPALVIGDLNSGSRLGRLRYVTRHHDRVLDEFGRLGLVSAYHAFDRVDPGGEPHPIISSSARAHGTSIFVSCRDRGDLGW